MTPEEKAQLDARSELLENRYNEILPVEKLNQIANEAHESLMVKEVRENLEDEYRIANYFVKAVRYSADQGKHELYITLNHAEARYDCPSFGEMKGVITRAIGQCMARNLLARNKVLDKFKMLGYIVNVSPNSIQIKW